MGAANSTEHPHSISTPIGKFNGLERRDKDSGKPVLHQYFRVAYAQPPIGSLRWRRPQPLSSDHTYDSENTKFGPICPQPEYGHNSCLINNPNAAPDPENIQSEDCLYLNIWVPAGSPPTDGWPVQFHIHGGWLQVGDANQANDHDPFDLLLHTTPRIIVAPTYRLNLFGFLGGADLASLQEDPAPGNYGLWDQRLALEWTHTNIHALSGNPNNITVGGLSAGANSTFFQLHYDSHLPEPRRIIKRIYLWSNAVAIQPNATTSDTLTEQFNSLCAANNISPSLSAASKLEQLRSVPAPDLIASLRKLKLHTFRSSTDNSFIPATFLSSLHSGVFTTLLAQHNISVLLGEVRDEKNLYKLVNPPHSYTEMLTQLRNYYPQKVCDKLLTLYKLPNKNATGKETEDAYAEVFSQMVADLQVHASIRGFNHLLVHPPSNPDVLPLPEDKVFRYRICWRAKCLDNWFDKEVGVTHSSDTPIWWGSGWRAGFTDQDKSSTMKFLESFGEFLKGNDDVKWGVNGEKGVRVLDEEGFMKVEEDEGWERGMEIWDGVWGVQKDAVAK